MLSIRILLLLLFWSTANAQEIWQRLLASAPESRCYSDKELCFTNTEPNSPSRMPDEPEQLGLEFYLYTRETTKDFYQKISYELPNVTWTNDLLNSERKTVFITHGFWSKGDDNWINEMKDALLEVEDVNVIVVNWSQGASATYCQAVANTQLVGALIGNFINYGESQGQILASRTHLIGHSLGAHVSGFVGKRTNRKLARITGLDPAGPFFWNYTAKYRLDVNDATFVDVIHTDAWTEDDFGFGISKPIGDSDFYVNGGTDQPECKCKDISCNHGRACQIMIESIYRKAEMPLATVCAAYVDYKPRYCDLLCRGGCGQVGYYAQPPQRLNLTVPFPPTLLERLRVHNIIERSSNQVFSVTTKKPSAVVNWFYSMVGYVKCAWKSLPSFSSLFSTATMEIVALPFEIEREEKEEIAWNEANTRN